MKRLKRIAALLIVGFLTFAPPGTMIFGVAFLLGLGGYFFNRNQTVEHNPQPQPAASSSSIMAEGRSPIVEKPRTFSELPAYLESFLPSEAKGKVRVKDNGVIVNFTLENALSPRDEARIYARDFIFAAYRSGLPVEIAQIIIRQPDGRAELTVTLGANVVATLGKSVSSDSAITSTAFVNWMKDAHRSHSAAEGADSARIGGVWAE